MHKFVDQSQLFGEEYDKRFISARKIAVNRFLQDLQGAGFDQEFLLAEVTRAEQLFLTETTRLIELAKNREFVG